MKCPYCETTLVNAYITDKNKNKKPISKVCTHCGVLSNFTKFFEDLQQRKKRELQEKRKKPVHRHRSKCSKCGSTKKITRKIPYTKDRQKRGESLSWRMTCKDCRNSWTANYPQL